MWLRVTFTRALKHNDFLLSANHKELRTKNRTVSSKTIFVNFSATGENTTFDLSPREIWFSPFCTNINLSCCLLLVFCGGSGGVGESRGEVGPWQRAFGLVEVGRMGAGAGGLG